MTKQTLFSGIATALATPMTQSGEIDFDAYGRLIDWQIDSGIAGLVACGTTGEASTMTIDEHKAVISYTVKRAKGRVPVIAGTGGNCTRKAVELTQFACNAGASGCLIVTPYYNKATQIGLIEHYTAIADASCVPIILYNVPGRTGCNLLPETCERLAEHPRIVAVKEASGNISQIVSLFEKTGDVLDIYSGNDDQVVPILAMGGAGCISVLSNIVPYETVTMFRMFSHGDVLGAAKMQCELLPLIDSLFSEVNPIPVKAALAKMGYGFDRLRLPLTSMSQEKREILFKHMSKWGL